MPVFDWETMNGTNCVNLSLSKPSPTKFLMPLALPFLHDKRSTLDKIHSCASDYQIHIVLVLKVCLICELYRIIADRLGYLLLSFFVRKNSFNDFNSLRSFIEAARFPVSFCRGYIFIVKVFFGQTLVYFQSITFDRSSVTHFHLSNSVHSINLQESAYHRCAKNHTSINFLSLCFITGLNTTTLQDCHSLLRNFFDPHYPTLLLAAQFSVLSVEFSNSKRL